MVASPNINPAARLALLAQQVEEAGRSNKYPLSVAPDGQDLFSIRPDPGGAVAANGQPVANVTLGYGDGTAMLRTLPTNSGNQRFELLDNSGRVVMANDPVAGYGMTLPEIVPFIYPSAPDLGYVLEPHDSVEDVVGRGQCTIFNPCLVYLLRFSLKSKKIDSFGNTIANGTACAGRGWLRLTCNGETWNGPFGPLMSVPANGVAAATDPGIRGVRLPERWIGKPCIVNVMGQMTSGANTWNELGACPVYMSGQGAQFVNDHLDPALTYTIV